MEGGSLGDIHVGDVVQIDPEHDERFGACFMVVTELRPTWDGLIGYVTVPGGPDNGGGQAYYRIRADHVVRIGKAEWVTKSVEVG